MLSSERTRAGAAAVASRAQAAGLEQTGTLSSDRHSSLQGGYWVAYAGVLSQSEARAQASRAKSSGFGDAYPRFISTR